LPRATASPRCAQVAAAVIALLASIKADGIYVPLDPASPVRRLKKILESCDPSWLLAAGVVTRHWRSLSRRALEPAPAGWLAGQPWTDGANFHVEFT